MELNKVLDIKVGSTVAIVGAGGKSTLMYTLAEEFRKDYKCLVTTTTKVYVPNKEKYDFMAVGAEEFNEIKKNSNNGIYVYGNLINKEDKLMGVTPKELDYNVYNFQYVFIEADGSKRKPIKGWKDTEPVICNATTHTIGIISIESIGKEINEDNVHRVKEFLSITNTAENNIISEDNIVSMIFNPKGLFKNSRGERILFINKVESKQQWLVAEQLIHNIEKKNDEILQINKIIVGSLLKRNYLLFSKE